MIRFSVRPLPDPDATERRGHQAYRNADWYEIFIGKNDKREGEVTAEKLHEWDTAMLSQNGRPDDQKRKWGQMYRTWAQANAEPAEGTSIRVLPFLTPADVENLLPLGINTLEALVTYPNAEEVGIEPLRLKALDYLTAAQDHGRIVAENERLRAENEDFRARLAEFQAAERDAAKGKTKAA